MTNNALLERAFGLADSGRVRSISEIKHSLAPHYRSEELAQLSGVLAKQLSSRVKAALERNGQG